METRTIDEQLLLERFDLIVNGPALFNALVSGIELGVFLRLKERPGSTLASVASDLRLGQHQLRVLMLALCATGLVIRNGDGYENTLVAERLLAEGVDSGWPAILVGWRDIYYGAFPLTTEALREQSNQPALKQYPGTGSTLYERLAFSPAKERRFLRAMSAFTEQTLNGLIDGTTFSAVRRVLDVGGGDGTTARAIAQRYPGVGVDVLDLENVINEGLRSDAADGSARIGFVRGNFLTEELPRGFDCILFSHVLEVLSESDLERVLQKAHGALTPGGKIVIYGFAADELETGGIYCARLALYLNVLATGSGMTYPVSAYEASLRIVGFDQVEATVGLPFEHAIVTALRA